MNKRKNYNIVRHLNHLKKESGENNVFNRTILNSISRRINNQNKIINNIRNNNSILKKYFKNISRFSKHTNKSQIYFINNIDKNVKSSQSINKKYLSLFQNKRESLFRYHNIFQNYKLDKKVRLLNRWNTLKRKENVFYKRTAFNLKKLNNSPSYSKNESLHYLHQKNDIQNNKIENQNNIKHISKSETNKEFSKEKLREIIHSESTNLVKEKITELNNETLRIAELRTREIIKKSSPMIEKNIMKKLKRTSVEESMRRQF